MNSKWNHPYMHTMIIHVLYHYFRTEAHYITSSMHFYSSTSTCTCIKHQECCVLCVYVPCESLRVPFRASTSFENFSNSFPTQNCDLLTASKILLTSSALLIHGDNAQSNGTPVVSILTLCTYKVQLKEEDISNVLTITDWTFERSNKHSWSLSPLGDSRHHWFREHAVEHWISSLSCKRSNFDWERSVARGGLGRVAWLAREGPGRVAWLAREGPGRVAWLAREGPGSVAWLTVGLRDGAALLDCDGSVVRGGSGRTHCVDNFFLTYFFFSQFLRQVSQNFLTITKNCHMNGVGNSMACSKHKPINLLTVRDK